MAKNTKIIELFGLPACGKTTLCLNLTKDLQIAGNTVSSLHSMEKSLYGESVWTKCKCFPYKSILLYLLLFISLPHTKYRSFYKLSIKISRIYKYSRIKNKFDYLLIDHGIVQNVVSILFQKPPHLSNFSLWLLKHLLFVEKVDTFVYCSVSPMVAIKRIRDRNDRSHGRWDDINEDDILFYNFMNQKTMFDILGDNIKMNRLNYIKVDMEESPIDIASKVYAQIL